METTKRTPARPTARNLFSWHQEARRDPMDPKRPPNWFTVFEYEDGAVREYGSDMRDMPPTWRVVRPAAGEVL